MTILEQGLLQTTSRSLDTNSKSVDTICISMEEVKQCPQFVLVLNDIII